MKKIKYLLILFLLGLIPRASRAQNEVYDMLQNQRYDFNAVYNDVNFEQPYFGRTIEIGIRNFIGRPQPVYKKLNDEMLKMIRGYIENEARFLALHREANARLEVFKNLKNSQNSLNNYDYSERSQQLTKIDCMVKSIIANQAFYEIDFEFEIKPEDYNSNNFHVRHYYKADLLTGKITAWKPAKGLQNKKGIETLITTQLNATYLTLTDKLRFNELESNGNDTAALDQPEAKPVTNLFSRINLDEADFYWYRNGLIIQFQQYAKGNTLFEGRFFKMFFPYSEGLKIARLLPDFSFAINLPRIENNFKGWNNTQSYRISALRREPSVFDVLQLNNYKGKTKMLQQTVSQTSSNGKTAIVNKTVYEFSTNQKLTRKLTFSQGGALTDSVSYQYNAVDNIKLSISRHDDDPVSTMVYEYDALNNLAKYIEEDKQSLNTTYFFYNKNVLYYFALNPLESERDSPVTRYEQKANAFCYNETCYQTDDKGRIIALSNNKLSDRGVQIGRDAIGRIIETHFDGDRYNYYFEYDSQHRLKKYQSDEEKVVFEYKDSDTYPNLIIKQNSRSNTHLEERLEWTFY